MLARFVCKHDLDEEEIVEQMVEACKTNNVRSLQFCRSQGISMNMYLDRENLLRPLHIAASHGATLVCVFLILNGANIDAFDIDVSFIDALSWR
jgi:hypothetical protein